MDHLQIGIGSSWFSARHSPTSRMWSVSCSIARSLPLLHSLTEGTLERCNFFSVCVCERVGCNSHFRHGWVLVLLLISSLFPLSLSHIERAIKLHSPLSHLRLHVAAANVKVFIFSKVHSQSWRSVDALCHSTCCQRL